MTHQLGEAKWQVLFQFDLKGPVQFTYFISTKLCLASVRGSHTPHTPTPYVHFGSNKTFQTQKHGKEFPVHLEIILHSDVQLFLVNRISHGFPNNRCKLPQFFRTYDFSWKF